MQEEYIVKLGNLLQVSRGLVDRNAITGLTLVAKRGQNLDIIVENQGHINFGPINNGSKVHQACFTFW